jgi:hypothetical protein
MVLTAGGNAIATSAMDSLLALKAPLANPTFTGAVRGIAKAMVNRGSVDNATDAAEQISTATQPALNLKANDLTTYDKVDTDAKFAVKQDALLVCSPAGGQPLIATGSTRKGLAVADSLTSSSSASALTIVVTALAKSSVVGLGSVGSTPDSAKIFSAPQQPALDLREYAIAAATLLLKDVSFSVPGGVYATTLSVDPQADLATAL